MSCEHFEESEDYAFIPNVFCEHQSAEMFRRELQFNDRFELAYYLIVEGFSVIPLWKDGSVPARRWKSFQARQANLTELADWFVFHDFCPAIVTGQLSRITVVECDSPQAVMEWEASSPPTLVQQQTPRGRHFVYRHNHERNTLDRFLGIDRRGEGGYIKAFPDSRHWTAKSVKAAPLLC